MRHHKSGKKLGRTPAHRKALFRNMVTSLLKHQRIVTTEVKAKEIGRLTEKMITLGKRGDLHARRQAIAFIKSNEVVKSLFSEYADRYKDRDGGYTRVIKLEPRSGDNAPMAIVELVDRPVEEKSEEKQSKKADKKTAARKKPAEKKAAAKETKPSEKAKKEVKEDTKSRKSGSGKTSKKSEKTEKPGKKTTDAPKKAKKSPSAKKKDDSPEEESQES